MNYIFVKTPKTSFLGDSWDFLVPPDSRRLFSKMGLATFVTLVYLTSYKKSRKTDESFLRPGVANG